MPRGPTITEDNVTHRISIVKFADDSYMDRIGDNRQNYGNRYNYTQIVKDFTDVDQAGVTELSGAINSLEPAGAASVDYGLNLAEDVLNGQWTQSWNGPDLKGARSDAKKLWWFSQTASPTTETTGMTVWPPPPLIWPTA